MAADYTDFFKIRDEIMEQLDIDDVNISEKAMKLPAIKQYWIAKMIQSKIEIRKIEDKKSEGLKRFIDACDVGVSLSKDSLIKKYNASPEVKAMNERIEVLNIIVEYLNDAKFAIGRATDDIKNRIELMKLEQL